jgi:nucleotide-binding universal stress UspA family protein
MYRSILVPLDGSALSEQALPLACDLARHLGASLHLAYVHSAASPASNFGEGLAAPDAQSRARAYLDQIADQWAAAAGRPITAVVLDRAPDDPPGGAIAVALARYVAVAGADLIIMTSHGRGGLARLWFGSVAADLAACSPVPMLLLRPAPAFSPAMPTSLRRLLIPLDGTAWAEQILAPMTALALATTADLNLLHVVDPHCESPWASSAARNALPMSHEARQIEARAYLDAQACAPRAAGLAVECYACLGAPVARAVLEEAEQLRVDLIALTVSGGTGWRNDVSGRVAAAVLREARIPLLLYRPPLARAVGA